ncbi:glycosyltransferase family 4 protein [Quadrisphaera sp. GCM10027208]|uniref:glycosyltransferase family 4 protein n=1 Tax=Quadrisphaera sp. GCM10027208 TaxID=3273423 RepID=UPI003614C6DC
MSADEEAVGSRVLIIGQLPPPIHGSSAMTRLLADRLAGAGYTVDVVSKDLSRSASEIGSVTPRKLLRAFGSIRRIRRAVKRGAPDVCVFFVSNRLASFLLDCKIAAWLRRRRLPYISYIHANGYAALARRSPWLGSQVQTLLGGSHAVVVLGEAMKPDVLPFTEDAIAIPNAVPDVAGDYPPESRRAQRVTFMSNLLPEKGADAFISLAAALHASHPDAEFIVAGTTSDQGYLSSLQDRASEYGLGDNLRFTGHVSGDKKWRLLASTDVFVFPSTYPLEAQPLTVVEAMSMSIPVVAYDTGGLADLVPPCTGRLVRPGDIGGLVTAVAELLSDVDLCRASRKESREAYERNHSVEAFTHSWRSLLARVVSRG